MYRALCKAEEILSLHGPSLPLKMPIDLNQVNFTIVNCFI